MALTDDSDRLNSIIRELKKLNATLAKLHGLETKPEDVDIERP